MKALKPEMKCVTATMLAMLVCWNYYAMMVDFATKRISYPELVFQGSGRWPRRVAQALNSSFCPSE